MTKKLIVFFTIILLLLSATSTFTSGVAQSQDSNLHVPSPDWEDQVIYFIMIDRFNDGDPSNNDQGAR